MTASFADEASLDASVGRTLEELAPHSPLPPEVLLLVGTGTGLLPTRLKAAGGAPLAGLGGVPAPWRDHYLHWGRLGKRSVWMLEDRSDEPTVQVLDHGQPSWAGAFPCWLAADAGANTMVVTAAGSGLPAVEREALAPGQLALLSDHLNLSGSTPLMGLADSRLGPMFPDQTTLHDKTLRARARSIAQRLGLDAREAVCACTSGPSLDTPAERRFYARAGADVSVQGMAAPLLGAAHAGLVTLGIVVVTDHGDETVDLQGILAVVQRTAPVLEDFLVELFEAEEASSPQ